MSLKDYKEMPEEGLYEKIQHRLQVRRMWRRAGITGGVALVAVAAVLAIALPKSAEQPQELAYNAAPATTAVEQAEAVVNDPAATEPAAAATPAPAPAAVASTETVPSQTPAAAPVQTLAPEEEAPAAMPVKTAPVSVAAPVTVAAPATPSPAMQTETAAKQENATAQTETAEAEAKGGVPGTEPVHYDDLIWVPNIIVPDGDVEENRTFRAVTNTALTDFVVYICNRGGRQIFRSTDQNFIWDATYNGQRLPQGSYVFVINYRDSENTPHTQKGTVTVVR